MMTRANPQVSVILPAYYSDRSIAQCLEAISEQTFQDFEVIVVNSSPETRTHEIVTTRFPKVIFKQSPTRLLPHAARNLGVSLATGELLVFTDPDCLPQPEWLATLVQANRAGWSVVQGSVEPKQAQLDRARRSSLQALFTFERLAALHTLGCIDAERRVFEISVGRGGPARWRFVLWGRAPWMACRGTRLSRSIRARRGNRKHSRRDVRRIDPRAVYARTGIRRGQSRLRELGPVALGEFCACVPSAACSRSHEGGAKCCNSGMRA